MENNIEKSKSAFIDLINLMDRRDLDEILNADGSNWKEKVGTAMLAYSTIMEKFDRFDIRRINVEACWMKALYLAGYEHGILKETNIIFESEEIVKFKDVLRRIQEMAAEEIRTGNANEKSIIWQIEADARAAIETK